MAHIALVVTTTGAGVAVFSAALGGYAFGPLGGPARIALFVLSPLLIDPAVTTSVIGGAGVALVLGYQLWRYKVLARGAATAS